MTTSWPWYYIAMSKEVSRIKRLAKHPLFFPIITTIVYFVANLFLAINHETWQDEANPWQVAKNMNFENIFEVMQGEGHPLLWYLILMPFAKLGFPFVTIHFISLAIMTLAVFLLSRYAPFSKKVIIAIVLSAGFFYYFPVISRNYCLMVLGIVVVALAYKERLKHPIRYALALALLCQSHFLAMGLALALIVIYLVDYFKKFGLKKIKLLIAPFFIISFSVAASLPIVLSAFDSHVLIAQAETQTNIDWLLELNKSLFGTVIPIFELTFLCASIYLFFRYPRQLIFLIVSIAAWFFILINVYVVSWFPPQRAALVLLFLIFAFWTAKYEKPSSPTKLLKYFQNSDLGKLLKKIPATTLLVIPVFSSIPNTMVSSFQDLTSDYSHTNHFVNYVNKTLPDYSVILVADSTAASAAIAYVPLLEGGRQIYDVNQADFVDYYRFTNYPELDAEDFEKSISGLSERHIYYLAPASTCSIQITPESSWELLQIFEEYPNAFQAKVELYHVSDPK